MATTVTGDGEPKDDVHESSLPPLVTVQELIEINRRYWEQPGGETIPNTGVDTGDDDAHG